MPKFFLNKHYPSLILQIIRLSKENYVKFAYLNMAETKEPLCNSTENCLWNSIL